MSISILIGFLLVAAFLWWAGFYATKRMRVRKNVMRAELARQRLAEKSQLNQDA